MERNTLVYANIILLPVFIFILYKRRQQYYRRLPPGPPGWPLFGHIFQLGTAPHRTIAGLKHKYGPVVWLKIGSVNTMAILNAEVATEFFKNHDLEFADRNINDTVRSKNYDKASLALAPYGVYWRVMRRICTTDMFVIKKINETVSVRRKCVNNLITWIENAANSVNEISVARYVFLASFNIVGNLMLSRDLVDPESKEALDFFNAVQGLAEWSGHPNISDLFSWLRRLDLQGLRRNMDRDMEKALDIAATFVKDRIDERNRHDYDEGGGEKRRKDFLDVLLEFEGGENEPAKLSEFEINIFILEIFLAGSETSSTTIEWALTELLRNPKIMVKVKNEISRVVASNEKVEESDIDKLPYLQAVIKETLRLHPPLPLLLPRKAIQDTNFMGYFIPKSTQVFVNVWAIGRDEGCWEDPLSFKPERFVGPKIEYKGQNFEFIPFGAGRRICPGLPLAHRMMHFLLVSLLHKFDWELDASAKPVDMSDKIGIVARKLEPLKVVPRKHVF